VTTNTQVQYTGSEKCRLAALPAPYPGHSRFLVSIDAFLGNAEHRNTIKTLAFPRYGNLPGDRRGRRVGKPSDIQVNPLVERSYWALGEMPRKPIAASLLRSPSGSPWDHRNLLQGTRIRAIGQAIARAAVSSRARPAGSWTATRHDISRIP
jgi:hypothetical protein